MQQRLILGSGSRYRREMFERLGLDFEVVPADIRELEQPGESGEQMALRLAKEKAGAVAARHPDALVIGCDQVAECNGRTLGKPGSRERAIAQLKALAGHDVHFHSAMTLQRGEQLRQVSVPTHVRLRTLSDAAIEYYVDRDQPLDCAGAMKSERLGIALAEFIRSDDPTALIGLPLIALTRMLGEFGVDVLHPTP
jgi:septum formation protein